jgi:putative Holliday junction resolvase
MTRLLGIDLGERRIGLAVGDTATGSVKALTTISHADVERDARNIASLVREQRIDELVVGLPLNMDGSVGPQAERTRQWADAVAEVVALPTSMRDERLTTEDAIDRIGPMARGHAGGPPTAHARRAYRARLDRLAAAAIVQAEVDARRSMAETGPVKGDE